MTDSRNHRQWPTRLGMLGILALVLGLTTWMRHGWLTVVNLDSAIYCLLADSLAQGRGYLLVSDPHPYPYYTFPPLLPWMLAGLQVLAHLQRPHIEAFDLQLLYKLMIHLMLVGGVALFGLWSQHLAQVGHKSFFPKPWLRWAMLLAVALGPLFYKYSEDVLSDVPFWAWVMLALYAAEVRGALPNRFVSDASSPPSHLGWFLLGLFAVLAAAMTRQMGLALVVQWIWSLVLNRCWKKAVISLLAFGLVLGTWQASGHVYRSQHLTQTATTANTLNQAGVQQTLEKSPIKLEFIKHFLVVNPVSQDAAKQTLSVSDRLQLVWHNLQHYGRLFLAQILPSWKVPTATGKINLLGTPALALLMACFIGIGLWITRHALPFTWGYVAVSMAVLLNYPYVSPRFLLPLMPYLLLALFLGLQHVARVLKPLGGKVAFGFTFSPKAKTMLALRWGVAWMLCPGLVWLAVGTGAAQAFRWINHGHRIQHQTVLDAVKCDQPSHGPSLEPANSQYYNALLWLKDHAPANTLVVSRKPPVTYYYSGLKSVAFPFTKNHDQLLAFLETTARQNQSQFPHLWILEDAAFTESEKLLSPVIRQHPKHFTLQYQAPHSATRIWSFRPTSPD